MSTWTILAALVLGFPEPYNLDDEQFAAVKQKLIDMKRLLLTYYAGFDEGADIFAQNDDGTLRLVHENLDECVLCELCINATPQGTVKVLKLYSGEALPA